MNKGTNIKLILILALLAFAAVFILQNTDIIEIKFLFWKLSLSRVLLLIGTTTIGFTLGVLTTLEGIRRKTNAGKTTHGQY